MKEATKKNIWIGVIIALVIAVVYFLFIKKKSVAINPSLSIDINSNDGGMTTEPVEEQLAVPQARIVM
jgi:YbbR domain-containing protein